MFLKCKTSFVLRLSGTGKLPFPPCSPAGPSARPLQSSSPSAPSSPASVPPPSMLLWQVALSGGAASTCKPSPSPAPPHLIPGIHCGQFWIYLSPSVEAYVRAVILPMKRSFLVPLKLPLFWLLSPRKPTKSLFVA